MVTSSAIRLDGRFLMFHPSRRWLRADGCLTLQWLCPWTGFRDPNHCMYKQPADCLSQRADTHPLVHLDT